MQAEENIGVCSRLKEERRRLGMKQDEAREICATTVQTIRRWERNIPIPAHKLAALVGVGFDGQYVLTGVRSTNLRQAAAGVTDGALDSPEQLALERIRRLSEAQQQALIQFLDAIL